jgi:class 3 adenylate cyclase/tetratricopeptide (TPR) repeat protein
VKARKTVTALFADVAGSTALGERLDPEALREVMSRYFDQARVVIERHGGTVEKFIGDAVMAVFGVPAVHEDDALRAVRAAAELGAAVHALSADLEGDVGVGLQVRIGVNTGEVVAGDPTAGQTLVTGDAVNVAARLEQVAEPGQILVGEETYRLIRDAVRVEAVAPPKLKGKADPIAAYRLVGVVPGAPAFLRRLDSPLVGRNRELAALQAAFEEAVAESACRLVTVVGEAGVGKSRLVSELMTFAEDRSTVLSGRCLPYGEGITFWPIAEAVKAAAGVTERDSPEDARSRIHRLLGMSEDAELIGDRVAAAIGLGGSGGELQETFWAIRRLLEALAEDGPLVTLVEDIHWAEPTLLDLLQYVAGFSTGRPILLLCTARPELRDARPDWESTTSTVTLRPLTEDQIAELIENLLGRAGLAQPIRARITEAAEGNPLFVEEMLRMLIDDGLLVRDDGQWRLAGDLLQLSIPGNIHALLSARLDRLDEEERAVVQRAAVVGKVFYWGAVAALSPEEIRPRVGADLQALIRKELVRPESSSFAGEDAFRFSHILVRDAAYQSIPKQTRADLHERFAGWLEQKAGQRIVEYEEILGYHLEQSFRYRTEILPGDPGSQQLAIRAAERLARAGRSVIARGDMPAAVNLLSRATGLLRSEDPLRAALLADLGTALFEIGELGRAEAMLTEAVEAARAIGDPGLETRATVRHMYLRLHKQGPLEGDAANVEAAVRVLERLGDDWGLAEALNLAGILKFWEGRAGDSQVTFRRAADVGRRAGNRRQEHENAGWLALSAAMGPTPAAEGERLVRAMLEEAPGDRALEAGLLRMQSSFLGMQGRFDEARVAVRRAKALADEFGLEVEVAGISRHSGYLEMLAGQPEAAEREFRWGYEMLERMGNLGHLASHAPDLAEALLELGREEEALRLSERTEEIAASDDVDAQVKWRTVQSRILARRGELGHAEAMARKALQIAERTDYLDLHARALMGLAEVLQRAGRREEAAAALDHSLKLLEQKGNVALAEQVRKRQRE